MSAFTFGFGDDDDDRKRDGTGSLHARDGEERRSRSVGNALEVTWPEGGVDAVSSLPTEVVYVPGEHGRQLAMTKVLSLPGAREADIVEGVYEGGRKVWEGSLDLVSFLDKPRWREAAANATVIELGCGHALPALFTLHFGAAKVHMQDYNEDVLREVTIPNTLLGGYPDTHRAKFFAADWSALPDILPAGARESYDLVLTAETIYALSSLRALARCIVALLKPGTGTALVAAKRYYFGVGGGTANFIEVLQSEAAAASKTVLLKDTLVLQDGHSNVREILQLAIRSSPRSS